MDGVIDEARVSSTVRSANWILTEYNNQNDPSSFYILSPEAPAGSLCCTSVSNTSLSETICNGSYQFGTNTYTQSGTYIDTLTNSFGCDSIVTLNLTLTDPDLTYRPKWTYTAGSNPNTDWGWDVKIDKKGFIYVVGTIRGFIDFDPGPSSNVLSSKGGDDVFILKLAPDSSVVWVKSFGGSGIDMAQTIAIDSSGNVYTAGWFSNIVDFDPGPGTYNLSSTGGLDIFVQKLDTDGDFQWAGRMGGSGTDNGHVHADPSGNVYITGRFQGTADLDPSPSATLSFTSSNYDGFIAKLNTNGNLIWAKNINGSGSAAGFTEMAHTDSQSNVYIAGSQTGTATFATSSGPVVYSSKGQHDLYIQKLDPNGNFIWIRNIGGNGNERVHRMNVDVNNDILVTGHFENTVNFAAQGNPPIIKASLGDYDAFTLKLDSSGKTLWANQTGGSLFREVGTGIETDRYRNIYETGYFAGTTDLDPGPGTLFKTVAGMQDVYVRKLNSAGEMQWVKSFGSGLFDQGRGLAITKEPFPEVVVTGRFGMTVTISENNPALPSFDMVSNGSNNDSYVLKFTPEPYAELVSDTFDCNATKIRFAAAEVYDNISWQIQDKNGTILNTYTSNNVATDTLSYNHSGSGDTITVIMQATKGCYSFQDTLSFLPTTGGAVSITNINDTTCANQPYSFNGQLLTASGVYVDTLPNRFGCDSIITLDFTVNPTSATALVDTVCSDALPYNFVSQLLTVSGVYVDTLPNRFGCDSIITLDLTVNPTSATALVDTVCSDALPYNFVSQLLTVSGVYVDTLPNRFGCDSIITLDLTINPTSATALVDVVCSDALPYNFVSQLLTSSGVYVDTLPNRFGCDSIITLDLTVNPTSVTALVDTVCSDVLPYNFVSQLLTVSGVYVDTLPNRFGCDSIITLDFTVNPTSATALVDTVCSDVLPYNFVSQSLTVSGIYVDTLPNRFGCDSIITLDLTVNPTSDTALSVIICNDALPYNFVSQSLTASGIYTDTLPNRFGCDSIITLDLSILPVAFDTLSATICSNELYSYNNQNLNVAGIYEDTLTAPNGCNLYQTLDLRVLPANYELLQDTIISSLLPYAFGSRNLPLPGTYVDSLTNLFGCDSVVVLNLLVLEDFVIPNVITPNNDGLNDFFVLPGLSFFAPVSIKIYNRWGKEVYSQSDYQNDWQAKGLPSGTYFVILTTRQGYVYKSWVQVMR